MNILFYTVFLLVTTLSFSAADWSSFKLKNKKKYSSPQEEARRRAIFLKNQQLIDNHNERFKKGLVSYSLGMNKLGDLEASELPGRFKGFIPQPPNVRALKVQAGSSTNNFQASLIPSWIWDLFPFNLFPRPTTRPTTTTTTTTRPTTTTTKGPSTTPAPVNATLDWRTRGYVTAVKNQLNCGSCWAFSANGAIEGQWFKKTGNLISLSEQNLIDCTFNNQYGNSGCNGGNMENAYDYVIANKGVEKESTYPYQAKEGTCNYKAANFGASVQSYVDLPKGEIYLFNALTTVGPIAVAIDSSRSSFQFYKSGVYDEPTCSSTNLDHAVLAVGYGTLNGKDYWIVKNSWGTSWGDQGYILMSRNKNNQCGIATYPSYPIV